MAHKSRKARKNNTADPIMVAITNAKSVKGERGDNNAAFMIERADKTTGEFKPSGHIVFAANENHAVAGKDGFVVGRKRGYKGTAVAKSGTKYRAVAIA